ncbi:STAS domain-containing protein [Catellatospora sichuanensis]|uniref:STAS domain-containing protein n=1 Tax=Catellatospora sichuanensis TaxID=1969805 RepID=UPI001182D71E|nr:STAS domain-containing protein [Catellatospora sichuanensis]
MEVAKVDVHGGDPREAVVAVSGEIDLAVREDLLNSLYETIHTADVTRVVVDLSQVSFMDSTGLHVLFAARKRAHRSGVAFNVVGAVGLVRRVMAVTGVLELLTGEAVADELVAPPAPATETSQAADPSSATLLPNPW